jgi:hypothetical protein
MAATAVNGIIDMRSDFVLVAGPLVGSSSWEPTARQLRDRGRRVHVPDVLTACGTPPPWSQWTSHLINLIPGGNEPILVGHSSASAFGCRFGVQVGDAWVDHG